MYVIKVDELEEKKNRTAFIKVKEVGDDWTEDFMVEEKNIISMDCVLRFIDSNGKERVYGNTPYEIEFEDE